MTLLTISAISLPLFIWWRARTKHPLLDVRLFKIGGFSIATVVVMIVTAALYGGLFLLPVFLESPTPARPGRLGGRAICCSRRRSA